MKTRRDVLFDLNGGAIHSSGALLQLQSEPWAIPALAELLVIAHQLALRRLSNTPVDGIVEYSRDINWD